MYIGTRGAPYVLWHKEQFCNSKAKLLESTGSYLKGVCQVCKTKQLLTVRTFEKPEQGLCTLSYTRLYCPSCLGPEKPKVELQVIKCIVVTRTVSWHRGQRFYSSLPLVAWVMLLLTSLCGGVLGPQWALCLVPWDAFSGQTGTSLWRWIRSPATSQLSGEQQQWVVCLPAFLSAHRKLPTAASQSLCSL